jgi:enamine deaminase RidA (YjgF/YER057c/UK114 family)
MKRYAFLFLLASALYGCKQSEPKQTVESAVSADVESRLKELNIVLSSPPPPSTSSIIKTIRIGNLVYTSGHGPEKPDGSRVLGKLGLDLTLEQGQEAARYTGIALLSSLKAEIGDLNKVKRIVKVIGMVNCVEGFTDQPKVMNEFSDMMVAVFGEKGKHARSAVGMNALPRNMAIEIEMIVEVED